MARKLLESTNRAKSLAQHLLYGQLQLALHWLDTALAPLRGSVQWQMLCQALGTVRAFQQLPCHPLGTLSASPPLFSVAYFVLADFSWCGYGVVAINVPEGPRKSGLGTLTKVSHMKYLGPPQSGSQADTTASRNRFGQYYRNRAMPVNPATSKQTVARTSFGTIAAQWRTLSGSQRNAWEACAAEFPIVNSLGQTVTLTGMQQFIRANTAMVAAGLSVLTSPLTATDWSDNTCSLTLDFSTPTCSIAFTPPAAGQVLVFDMGQQVSAGIGFYDNFRFIVSQDDGDTSPVAVLSTYRATWGDLIEDKKIFVRCRCLNECGVFGPEFISSAIVQA